MMAGGSGRLARAGSIAALPAFLLITSMAVLIQSYVFVKVAFLVLFLGAALLSWGRRQTLMIHPPLLVFYLATIVLGIAAALVGLFRPGNFTTGILEALRLYCVWSVAFFVLYTLLRNLPSLELFHAAMVAAGIGVAAMNLLGLADTALGWGIIPESVRTELDLGIGLRDGFWQITSHNIGTLFLVVPYLMARLLRGDAQGRSWPSILALILSLATAAASGRRALWLVVALAPATILGLALLTASHGALRRGGRRLLWLYTGAGAVAVVVLASLPRDLPDIGPLGHLQAAFSSVDERTIQKPYLIEAFEDAPFLGSGFGGVARYLRNFERPWTGYELTYYQMLFNLGAVGFSLMALLFGGYFLLCVRQVRRTPRGSAIPFALLVAYCSFLLGAYSNRYFGSFDLLFFVGILPYLATFRAGFGSPEQTVAAP